MPNVTLVDTAQVAYSTANPLPTANSGLIAALPASLGQKAPAASLAVIPAGFQYETVAASQTDQVMGGAGAIGDYIHRLIIMPTAVTAGTVTLKDGTTVILTFTTGTLPSLAPIMVELGLFSVNGPWKVTTGASETAMGIGNFSA